MALKALPFEACKGSQCTRLTAFTSLSMYQASERLHSARDVALNK